MKLFGLSLRQRLILAVVPGAVMSLAFLLDDSDVDLGQAPILVYAALHGGLVMAPFITSRARLLLRFGVVAFSSVLIALATMAMPYTDITLGLGGMLDVVAIWLIPALILGFVLYIAAPLRVSGKYWIYVGVSGLISGALFLAWGECCFHPFSRNYPWWHDLLLLLPFVVFPMSFSAAVYFGTVDARQSAESD